MIQHPSGSCYLSEQVASLLFTFGPHGCSSRWLSSWSFYLRLTPLTPTERVYLRSGLVSGVLVELPSLQRIYLARRVELWVMNGHCRMRYLLECSVAILHPRRDPTGWRAAAYLLTSIYSVGYSALHYLAPSCSRVGSSPDMEG